MGSFCRSWAEGGSTLSFGGSDIYFMHAYALSSEYRV